MSDFWRNLMLTVLAACAVVWTGFLLYAVKTGVDATNAVKAVLEAPWSGEDEQRIIDEMDAAIGQSSEPGEDGGESE